LILPTSQLQTQQLIASQIRSHVEYLIQTYIILLILYSKLPKNLASLIRFNDVFWQWLTFWPPCIQAVAACHAWIVYAFTESHKPRNNCKEVKGAYLARNRTIHQLAMGRFAMY